MGVPSWSSSPTIGAKIITNTIVGVPYYKYSRRYPKPYIILKAPILPRGATDSSYRHVYTHAPGDMPSKQKTNRKQAGRQASKQEARKGTTHAHVHTCSSCSAEPENPNCCC